MDVISDRIVDVGLNALGYLIAGGLGVLLHSIVLQRRPKASAAAEAATATGSLETSTAASDPGEGIEFVRLGTEPPTEAASLPNSAHRNRREIIRLAREMLEAGTAGEQIKKTLPISQSELALLKNASSN